MFVALPLPAFCCVMSRAYVFSPEKSGESPSMDVIEPGVVQEGIHRIKDYPARALKDGPKRLGQKRSSFGAWIRILSALLDGVSIPNKHRR